LDQQTESGQTREKAKKVFDPTRKSRGDILEQEKGIATGKRGRSRPREARTSQGGRGTRDRAEKPSV